MLLSIPFKTYTIITGTLSLNLINRTKIAFNLYLDFYVNISKIIKTESFKTSI